MKKTTKRLICAVLALFSLLSFAGCGAQPLKYQILEPYGYYPDTKDFPDTKWVCKELDMWFYMFADGERWMVGEYTAQSGETYPLMATFAYNHCRTLLGFDFKLPNSDMTSDEWVVFEGPSSVVGEYIYKDDVIIFEILEPKPSFWEYEGKTLTFEMAGAIAQEPESRWRCQEVDMYIDSFSDIDDYYKGEIVGKNGYVYQIHANLFPHLSHYTFSHYNGIAFVSMQLELVDDRLIGTVVRFDNAQELEYIWPYEMETVTFVREEISES